MTVYFSRMEESRLDEPPQLDDVSLLAGVLAGAGQSGLPIAQELMARFGSIAGVMSATPRRLSRTRGMGSARCRQLQLVRELARRHTLVDLECVDLMSSPERTRQFLVWHLAHREREVFCCLYLNAQHHLICCEDLFFGTLDGAPVYPREVVSKALHYGAAAVIFAHNHPSGHSEPSDADRRITERLRDALALVDIRVLDHFIVGAGTPFSFAEAGYIP